MKYSINDTDPREVLVVLCEPNKIPATSDSNIIEYHNFISKKRDYKGKYKSMESIDVVSDTEPTRYLFAGIGDTMDISPDRYRKLFGAIGSNLKKTNVSSVSLDINPILSSIDNENIYRVSMEIIEGISLALYQYKTLKKIKKINPLQDINFVMDPQYKEEFSKCIIESNDLVEATNIARDLINTPSNYQTPIMYANYVKEAVKDTDIFLEVLGEDYMKELGMHALIEVGKGSPNESMLMVLKYKGNPESDKTVGLVGKGITFDSGGLSLKNKTGLPNMKNDMAGSAAVLGAILAIAKQKLPVNVTVVVAAVENLLSGDAYKPGDIIDTMGGLTVQIESTDAEGRLALADTVYYAINNLGVDCVIDVATLTGAAKVMFGGYINPAMANNDELFSYVEEATNYSGEPIIRLPLIDEARQMIQCDIADLRNNGKSLSPSLGTVIGGIFIEYFVGDTPWVHIDIAGAGLIASATDYIPKGGTGKHVRNLYHTVKLMFEEKY